MLDIYKVPGTINYDDHPCFNNKDTFPNFQKDLDKFKTTLMTHVVMGNPVTYYKFGDGDYHFLKCNPVGSAQPGRRALSKPYESIDIDRYRKGVSKNDYITVEIYPENRAMFKELYPFVDIDYPAEYGYALVSNRWFFDTFKGRIGLIGGAGKIQLIKNLMQYKEYRQYLGLDEFIDYVSIPEVYACDDLDKTTKIVEAQLDKAKSGIFLVGIGHVKSGLLHRLKEMHPAVYMDVGSGINAIAGTICLNRPYAGGWTNYRLKDYNYDTVDPMDYHMTKGKNEIWL